MSVFNWVYTLAPNSGDLDARLTAHYTKAEADTRYVSVSGGSLITPSAAGVVGLRLEARADQTANLLELRSKPEGAFDNLALRLEPLGRLVVTAKGATESLVTGGGVDTNNVRTPNFTSILASVIGGSAIVTAIKGQAQATDASVTANVGVYGRTGSTGAIKGVGLLGLGSPNAIADRIDLLLGVDVPTVAIPSGDWAMYSSRTAQSFLTGGLTIGLAQSTYPHIGDFLPFSIVHQTITADLPGSRSAISWTAAIYLEPTASRAGFEDYAIDGVAYLRNSNQNLGNAIGTSGTVFIDASYTGTVNFTAGLSGYTTVSGGLSPFTAGVYCGTAVVGGTHDWATGIYVEVVTTGGAVLGTLEGVGIIMDGGASAISTGYGLHLYPLVGTPPTTTYAIFSEMPQASILMGPLGIGAPPTVEFEIRQTPARFQIFNTVDNRGTMLAQGSGFTITAHSLSNVVFKSGTDTVVQIGSAAARGFMVGRNIAGNPPTDGLLVQGATLIGVTSGTAGAALDVRTLTAAGVGLIVQGVASQTGNLFQLRDSSGFLLSSADNLGGWRLAIRASGIRASFSFTPDGLNDSGIFRIYGAGSERAQMITGNVGTGFIVTTISPTNVPLTARSSASPTASAIQRWENSAATALSLVTLDGEYEVTTASKGVIVKRPDGTRRRIRLDNADAIVVEAP